jgi:putative endonuclease
LAFASGPVLSTSVTAATAFFYMFHCYIIYSSSLDVYYVGYTADIVVRLAQHNTGISTFTSKANDWVLKHTEPFSTRDEAAARERKIKKKKSRKYVEWLISTTEA